MKNFSPGVYFGLPDSQYFEVPALSASGIKHLRQSPLDYWARTEWLGYVPDESEDESFARTLGKAYHKRILEGYEAFQQCYALAFNPGWYPEALRTAEDVKAALRRHKEGGTEGIKLTANKDDLISQLLSLEPTAKILDVMEDAYTSHHDGKIFLAEKYRDSIELAAAMIEKSPTLGNAFKGGIPEVSIFWVDEETGCPCKARLDYWKPRAVVDLKTFDNTYGKEVSRAVDQAFANNRYAFQATQYIQAVDAAIRLMKDGKVYGSAPMSITEAIIKAPADERKFLFVFQQKGPAPVACGKVFNRYSAMYQICAAHLETARRTYVEYSEKFGTDPWIADMPITELQDDEIAPWATE